MSKLDTQVYEAKKEMEEAIKRFVTVSRANNHSKEHIEEEIQNAMDEADWE